MTIPRERIDRGVELRMWSKDDEDVRRMVVVVCHQHGCKGYAELAEKDPDAFDQLYELVRDFRDEDEGR